MRQQVAAAMTAPLTLSEAKLRLQPDQDAQATPVPDLIKAYWEHYRAETGHQRGPLGSECRNVEGALSDPRRRCARISRYTPCGFDRRARGLFGGPCFSWRG